jgi:hypothetical protein
VKKFLIKRGVCGVHGDGAYAAGDAGITLIALKPWSAALFPLRACGQIALGSIAGDMRSV